MKVIGPTRLGYLWDNIKSYIAGLLDDKQDVLESGTNIKTINNESILGSGNITIQGGGGGDVNVIEGVTLNGITGTITNKIAALTETDPVFRASPAYTQLKSFENVITLSGESNGLRVKNASTSGYMDITSDGNVSIITPVIGTFKWNGNNILTNSSLLSTTFNYWQQVWQSGSDTVIPTVNAIKGQIYISNGTINISGTSITPLISSDIDGKANSADLATVATSGSYNDLDDKPTIPDVSGKENTSNKVTSLSSSSTDTQYPSAKCVYDLVGDIETILASI